MSGKAFFMVSRKGKPQANEAKPGERTSVTPAPPDSLHVSTLTWTAGTSFHRIHREQYSAAHFNPGVYGNARFSPIQATGGNPIPTLYGGETFECAAMETVFHDVSWAPGYKSYDKGKLAGQIHSLITPQRDLKLADLRSKALRKLGVRRDQLIDTEKDQYPATRRWALAIHAHYPDVQGLCWTSRQDDSARAIMLFGDRVAENSLKQAGKSRSLTTDDAAYDELLDLAEQIGINIVAGN